MMDALLDIAGRVGADVWGTFVRVWPFLVVSILAASYVTTYVGTDRLAGLLNRRVSVAIGGAVLFATLTPFCSCGTTAVLLGMMASSAPWAPLVAFMVSSPLTSPSELVFSAGLFGWTFALIFFLGTVVLGIVAGYVALGLDRAGLLKDQARMATPSSCCDTEPATEASVGPGAASTTEFITLSPRSRRQAFLADLRSTGRRIALFFFGFTAVGYLAIEAIPTAWLVDYLGGDSLFAVPLAALLGIPAYINTEASLPLVATLMQGGMGPGPAMAFLVTGAGTSIGAITGLLVISRRRVVGLVIGLLFAGAIGLGWIAQILL